MRDIFKTTLLTALALFIAAPVLAGANDWLSDPATETMWSDFINVNTADLGKSFHIESIDPIPYGSDWAHGYDRKSIVKATASMIRPYCIYRNNYDDTWGDCYWNFSDEDMLALPRGLQYTLVHEVTDANGNVLLHEEAPVTIGEGQPLSPIWSTGYRVDTKNVASGKSIEVKPTDNISYSAKWALNGQGFNRKITLYTVDQGENSILSFFSPSTSSVGDTYTIMTSAVEGEGTYQWDYSEVDPGVLPRGDSYTINYSIFDNDDQSTVFQNVTGVATITITPEPSLAVLALLVFGLISRKLN